MSTSSSSTRMTTVIGGRYRLLDELGRGGMATVHRAHDLALDREVAIKVLHDHLAADPTFLERFRREARAAAALAHPNVVGVHDWGESDEGAYLVLQLVEGLTLRQLLRHYGRLSADDAAAVLIPVAAGLGAAHRAGLVHRDVKPENVLIGVDGTVRITDFGLARAAATASVTFGTDVLVGSPHYLSPEAVRGEALDARSDVYALGVVLFECLTGRPPHEGESAFATALAHTSQRVPPPSRFVADVDVAFDEIVGWSTAMDPAHRYDDAQDFARAMSTAAPRPSPVVELIAAVPRATAATDTDVAPGDTLADDEPVDPDAATTVMADHSASPPRRRWLVPVIVVALILASGVGGYLGVDRWLRPPIDVPSVIGQSGDDAAEVLTEAGFNPQFAQERRHDRDVASGAVIDQDPTGQARRGATVLLVLSAGPRQIAVPEVAGQPADQAERALLTEGFEVRNDTRHHDEVAEGLVVETSPRSGTEIDEGTTVTLIISSGPAPYEVPELTDRGLSEVVEQMSDEPIDLQIERRHDARSVDTVIAQDPAAGTLVPPGTTVTIVVSDGPPPIEVPTVRGEHVDDATAQLRALGFEVRVERRGGIGAFLNPGRVFDQDPGPGATRYAGDTITLFAYEG